MPKKLSDTLVSIIVEMYEKGIPIVEIADKLRVDEATVHKYLTRTGTRDVSDYVSTMAGKRLTDEQIKEMIDYYKQGLTIADISEKTGVSYDTLYRYIRREGLTRKIPKEVYLEGIRIRQETGRPVAEIAEQLGISQASLYRKIRDYEWYGDI